MRGHCLLSVRTGFWMTVIKYFNPNSGSDIISSTYEIISGDANGAEISFTPGEVLLLKGEGFDYLDGKIVGGTLTRAKFVQDGIDIVRVNEISWNATEIDQFFYYSADSDLIRGSRFADELRGLAGNDTISGWRGDDRILGMEGRDTLAGNRGSDHFIFRQGNGRDVIVDFDATGDGRRQDYIEFVERTRIDFHQKGDDVVLTYGDGDSIILRNVDIADFDKSDIIWP
jgi:Ca2+-binding RTX toxin-like protein